MHDKPILADFDTQRFERDFDRHFRLERDRAEYRQYVRQVEDSALGSYKLLTFEGWLAQRAARGNREGQNHD